ncbi:MAG: phosphate ABC transporter substrate-binding protein [Proteobacteria bacterium]|nr:phosphate ABC transporter substrate-binding protein [Pseudomonadota bacterium]
MKHKNRLTLWVVFMTFIISTSLSWAENIVIKGSTTVLPIAQKVAEAYMALYPDVKISISGGGSGNGIKAIVDGTTDIADSSRFIKDSEVTMAVEKGQYPVPFSVAYDCIIPVVHPSNPIKDLTMNQLKAIYKGEVTNWNQVGGADLKIVVISRDTSSGTYEVWEEKIMKNERVFPGALLQASNGAVAQAVSKNKNALGYIGLGYLDKSVKALSVGNIAGSPETTLDGTFPISRPLYMFTNKWPAGELAKFMNYVVHPEKGQKLVKDAGFVPLY